MTPEQQRALDLARAAFAHATEGMSEDEISQWVKSLVREVRRDRAAMREEINRYSTMSSASFTELDAYFSMREDT